MAKRGRKPKHSKKKIVETLIQANGNLTVAAKMLGYEYYRFVKKVNADKDLREAKQKGLEQLLDIAEYKLREKIMEGDMTAIIFFLKCQGKNRGYTEKIITKNEDAIEITVQMPAELKALIEKNKQGEREDE